jgi:Tol biopolymer transport system component
MKGEKPRAVNFTGWGAVDPHSVGNRVVYVQQQWRMQDIWRIPGPGSEVEAEPERIIRTNPVFDDWAVRVSPSGDRILFCSDRSEAIEIWIANNDGSNPSQLTHFNRNCGTPNWDPFGSRIVFESNVDGEWNIYVVDSEGGEPLRLTNDEFGNRAPVWSQDGEWIYFHSSRSGDHQIWKIPSEGGEAQRVTQNGGFRGRESLDGKYFYFNPTFDNVSEIWRIPTKGGKEIPVLEEPIPTQNWDLVGRRLYYAKNITGEGFSIHRMDPDTGELELLFVHPDSSDQVFSLGVSPDERWIYYSFRNTEWVRDIMLVENFQ